MRNNVFWHTSTQIDIAKKRLFYPLNDLNNVRFHKAYKRTLV